MEKLKREHAQIQSKLTAVQREMEEYEARIWKYEDKVKELEHERSKNQVVNGDR